MDTPIKQKVKNHLSKVATATYMQKLAAMLDPVQSRMSTEIWTSDNKLRQDVKKRILELLYKAIPESRVSNVLIMGSLTSYQYNATSDLDLTVFVRDAIDIELGSAQSVLVSHISHIPIHPGTKRTMQYYVTKSRPRELESFENNSTAVYDVLSDLWITPPKTPDQLQDPENRFVLELSIAKAYKRDFIRLADKYDALKAIYDKTNDSGAQEQTVQALRNLIALVNHIYKERKDHYSGWGVGRESWRNVVFKVVQYSSRGDMFEKILKLGGELPRNEKGEIILI